MPSAIIHQSHNASLLPDEPTPNQRKRLLPFIAWLDESEHYWLSRDLVVYLRYYRDMLFDERGLSPASVASYLSTIRARYGELLDDPATRETLYQQTASDWPLADRKAFVDEVLGILHHAIHPKTVKVKVKKRQDDTHIRLNKAQSQALLNAPDPTTLKGLRDRAIIATLLCTGVRAAELIQIEVAHLYADYQGLPALLVPQGKGDKERHVVYGDLGWFIQAIEAWLEVAHIQTGIVFRRLYRFGHVGASLTTEGVRVILADYPIQVQGQTIIPRPHMLRRTLAKRLSDAGMSAEDMQDNFGHASIRTTKQYIGDMSPDRRKPPAGVYDEGDM